MVYRNVALLKEWLAVLVITLSVFVFIQINIWYIVYSKWIN